MHEFSTVYKKGIADHARSHCALALPVGLDERLVVRQPDVCAHSSDLLVREHHDDREHVLLACAGPGLDHSGEFCL